MTKVWFSDVAHFPSFSTVSTQGGHSAVGLFDHLVSRRRIHVGTVCLIAAIYFWLN
jgi:hypothetical protein